MIHRLRPDPAVSPERLERAGRHLVQDAAWATLAGSLYGGVVLVGFAVALGATPMVVGLLAAIPFLAQIAQVPAIALVERLRARRQITVVAASLARAAIFLLALLPGLEPHRALALLLLGQGCITLLSSVSACSFNSWMHQLLPTRSLGALFSRRLFWSTLVGSLGALFAGQVVQRWSFGDPIHGYSVAFAAAGLAGLASSWHLARIPEPPMAGVAALPVRAMLRAPFLDANYRNVLVFMASWNFASNLAAPFIAVYLLSQMALGLGVVTMLWMASQIASGLTLYLWGRLSDRLSNKAILAVALPTYFASVIALPFSSMPDPHPLTLALLFAMHVAMGAASGGIGLAIGNLGLKLAPPGQGTAYLSAASLAGSLAAGLASVLGGALAGWLASRELSVSVHWTSSPLESGDVATVLRFQHWEFLFALSFALGGYVLHRLSLIEEGKQISEREVVQELVAEARRSIDQLSPVEGLRSAVLFPFGRLSERRRRPRRAETTPRSAP